MLQVQTNPIAEPCYDMYTVLIYCNRYTKILDMSKGINSIISYSTTLEVVEIITFVPVTCPEIPGLLLEGTTGF